ncbi:MAG TPA: ATP-dependent DNA ligase [Terriglobales bacterium]|nr:ATP-dependent DNA ligase [Terriglobales bacterium]
MLSFSQTAERIAATTKKLQKTALLADYFKSVSIDQAAVAAVFFSGRPFPAWEETTLQVGGRLLWTVVEELSGKSGHELTAAYREHGDLGAVAGAVLSDGRRLPSPHSPTSVQLFFREIAAARGPSAKGALVRKLLSEISPLEAKYIVKIITGDLRIGLKESLVEEAIAKAFGETLAQVQRANMLLGDIGETLRLAAGGKLSEAKMRLFHPIGFMLASPAESAEDALSYFQNAWVEDKYDGIRAQAHCSGNTVRFFSRTRDEITESFPELPGALAGLPQEAILDGEILAWSYLTEEASTEHTPGNSEARRREPALSGVEGASSVVGRALPFSALQQRLGRKKVSAKLMRDVPVAYLVFDVLYAGGELVIDRPLNERAKILDALLAAERTPVRHGDTETRRTPSEPQARLSFGHQETDGERPATVWPTINDERPTTQLIRAPVFQASSPEELNQLFDAAQARGNEGLMTKDPQSPYTPGRRGKSWLKLKRELATLDVVVTAVEYGHGKRIGVLSDYTFAVRDGDRLLNIGKAYSGLTDAEILEMTKWFVEHTIEDQGFRRVVEPKIVLEVAFNNMMKSDRHASGYALRFPRIVKLRPDKLPEEADTLERAKQIFTKQHG